MFLIKDIPPLKNRKALITFLLLRYFVKECYRKLSSQLTEKLFEELFLYNFKVVGL